MFDLDCLARFDAGLDRLREPRADRAQAASRPQLPLRRAPEPAEVPA